MLTNSIQMKKELLLDHFEAARCVLNVQCLPAIYAIFMDHTQIVQEIFVTEDFRKIIGRGSVIAAQIIADERPLHGQLDLE